jgi:hypothetical protein
MKALMVVRLLGGTSSRPLALITDGKETNFILSNRISELENSVVGILSRMPFSGMFRDEAGSDASVLQELDVTSRRKVKMNENTVFML